MFRTRMQEFLDLGTRTHEKLREAVVVDRVRNWKDYFGFMALQMKGHTGPTAPRVFQFVRRSGLPDTHPLRRSGSPMDVVLRCRVSDVPRCRCKQYMCDPHFYQSLDFLTAAHVDKLPAALPTSFLERVRKTAKYKAMILRHADMLKDPAFGMPSASQELREWVNETRRELPPLKVTHCCFFARHRSLHDNEPVVLAEDSSCDMGPQASALEPPVAQVVVCEKKMQGLARKRKLREEAKTTLAEAEAAFKSSTVTFLMKHQEFSLSEASKIADVAWRKKKSAEAASQASGSGGRRPLHDDDGSDQETVKAGL
ncbi:unnamed protein product [Symbiodinium sp. CCMP2592]|nr:unnamed protein product [Symbiodinium sp. CCMP2592]CAE7725500.1 unnamed protein product [Symbiodinium sp. CCMP2592]